MPRTTPANAGTSDATHDPTHDPAHGPAHGRTPSRRRLPLGPALLVASVVLAIYVGRLIATVPASAIGLVATVPPEVRFLGGTLWQGTALLDHGYALAWRVPGGAVRDALGSAMVPLALRFTGGGPGAERATDLSTIARLGYQSIALTELRGTLDLSALVLAGNALGADCVGSATFAVERVGRGPGRVEAAGLASSTPVRCTVPGGEAFEVPALGLRLASDGALARGVLHPSNDPDVELAGVAVAAGPPGGADTLTLRIEPAGAALVPSMPSSRATILEMGIGSGLDLDL